jgi:hypothetical protein
MIWLRMSVTRSSDRSGLVKSSLSISEANGSIYRIQFIHFMCMLMFIRLGGLLSDQLADCYRVEKSFAHVRS